jgi:hypothetical protein
VPRPVWLPEGFAVIMVAVAAVCVCRLVVARRLGRRNHADVSAAHALMGLAMAGMLVRPWNVVPADGWAVTFGLVALWFGTRSVQFVVRHGIAGTDEDHGHHVSHYLIHMVMAGAMVDMCWRAGGSGGTRMAMGPSSGSAGDPGLTLLVVAVVLGSAVWQLDSMSRFARPTAPPALVLAGPGADGAATTAAEPAPPPVEQPFLAPRTEVGCHVLMCVTMGYMLILML